MPKGKPEIYADDVLYVLASCDTGNEKLDIAVEKLIMGYANLAAYCLKSPDTFDRLRKLIDMSQDMTNKFQNNQFQNK